MITSPQLAVQQYRYYTSFSLVFVAFYIMASVAQHKMIAIGVNYFPAGLLIIPACYYGMIKFNQLYGLRQSLQLLLVAIFCQLFTFACLRFAILAPPTETWHFQAEYAAVLYSSWDQEVIFMLANLLAFTSCLLKSKHISLLFLLAAIINCEIIFLMTHMTILTMILLITLQFLIGMGVWAIAYYPMTQLKNNEANRE